MEQMVNKLPVKTFIRRIAQHWPQASSLESDATLSLIRLNDLIRTKTEFALAPFHLSRAAFEVLSTLRAMPEPRQMTPRELSDSILITSGGMTKVLGNLESARLIKLTANENDRRSKLVLLTQDGMARVESAMESVMAQVLAIFETLRPASLKSELHDLLKGILDQLE
jgi:DNA-binding MarR family transcriptional regulator